MRLLEKMSKEVAKWVEHYASDFDYDKEALLESKPGSVFYWVLRKCGTNLYRDSSFIAAGKWNFLDQLEYYKDDYRKIYKIIVEKAEECEVEGILQNCDFDKTLQQLRSQIKTPESIIFEYKGEKLELDWTPELSMYDAMLEIRDYFENNNIYWKDINYNYKF